MKHRMPAPRAQFKKRNDHPRDECDDNQRKKHNKHICATAAANEVYKKRDRSSAEHQQQ